MPFGTGDIASSITPSLSSLNNLTSALSALSSIDFTAISSSITTMQSSLLSTINSYGLS